MNFCITSSEECPPQTEREKVRSVQDNCFELTLVQQNFLYSSSSSSWQWIEKKRGSETFSALSHRPTTTTQRLLKDFFPWQQSVSAAAAAALVTDEIEVDFYSFFLIDEIGGNKSQTQPTRKNTVISFAQHCSFFIPLYYQFRASSGHTGHTDLLSFLIFTLKTVFAVQWCLKNNKPLFATFVVDLKLLLLLTNLCV